MISLIVIPIILALVALYLHKHLTVVHWGDDATPLKLYNWEIILAIIVLLIPIVNLILYFVLLVIYFAGLACGDLKFDKKSKVIRWLSKEAFKK